MDVFFIVLGEVLLRSMGVPLPGSQTLGGISSPANLWSMLLTSGQ